MPNAIIPKKSSVASKMPLASDLQVGEIAFNLADQKIYSKNASGDVVLMGSGTGGGGGGATGGGSDAVFHENDQVVTTSYTITAGKNAMTAGPVTISSGVSVTIPNNSVWTVL